MPAILLPVFFIQLFFIVFVRKKSGNLRESILAAAVLGSALVAFATETLSLFESLNRQSIVAFWLAANLAAGTYLYFGNRQIKPIFEKISGFWDSPLFPKQFVFVIAGIYAIVLSIAAVAPPNTVDVLTYHLPRVAHWVQSETLAPAATSIVRQIYQAPLVEFHFLHLELLSGSDRFTNLVQFTCFLLCGVAASLIAGLLGLSKRGQFFTAFLTTTVPMAVLQASSAKNDLAAALFLLCFFYFYLKIGEKVTSSAAALAGLALGAALLTKATTYVFCFPIGALLFVSFMIKSVSNRSRIVALTALVVVIGLSMNAGHYARNLQAFGVPFASNQDYVANTRISAGILAANLVRNYAIHLGTTPVIDEGLERGVRGVLGAETENPDSTYAKLPFKVFFSAGEDYAGNPLHLIAITLAAGFFVYVFIRRRESQTAALIALSLVGGFLLFCLLLRWQPFHSRLHLPLFMLGCPLVVAFFERFAARGLPVLSLLTVLAAVPALFFGVPRPLIASAEESVLTAPRERQYFVAKPELFPAYQNAAKKIRELNPSEIGLSLAIDYDHYNSGDFEYWLWMAIKPDDFAELPRMRHVGVKNDSARLKTNQPPPEIVVSVNEENTIDGFDYEQIWREYPLRILRRTK